MNNTIKYYNDFEEIGNVDRASYIVTQDGFVYGSDINSIERIAKDTNKEVIELDKDNNPFIIPLLYDRKELRHDTNIGFLIKKYIDADYEIIPYGTKSLLANSQNAIRNYDLLTILEDQESDLICFFPEEISFMQAGLFLQYFLDEKDKIVNNGEIIRKKRVHVIKLENNTLKEYYNNGDDNSLDKFIKQLEGITNGLVR